MSDKIGSDIILATSVARYADGNNYTALPFKHAWHYTEGVFVLEAEQGAGTYTNETLDVYIMSFETLTNDWDVIGQFTQITDATTALRERIAIPYGLGRWLSCKWVIANAVVGEAYTFTVSGSVK